MGSSLFGSLTGGKNNPSSGPSWLAKHWDTTVVLVGIFIVAIMVRAYFAYETATEFGLPYLLGGGADSHYNARIVNYIAEYNEHLFADPLRAYPLEGYVNTRPPLYQWSVVLGGYLLVPFVGNLDKAINLSFIFSAAFWGALTIFPTYLIGKRTFGKKAGIAGAFLLAISAAHLERGVLTNTNHDAFSMFLIVTAFFFFMRSLEEIKTDRRWVSDWMKLDAIKEGILAYMGKNKKSMLYAAMTGITIGTIALTWKGYAYVMVIILVYFLIQLLVDKFRKRDSLGITVNIFIIFMLAFLIALPWYAKYSPGILTNWFQWPLDRWFQVPFLIFIGTFGVGVYFTVTRDLPWVLTFSILGAAGLIFFVLGPDIIQTAAAQYFIDNKLYATIAEAQAPMFSRLVMAGGVVTFFLSWVGIVFAGWHLRKEWSRSFIFILVWTAFAIYMATTATRFIFNAAPAFTLTAGWVVALTFDKANFGEISRYFRTHRGSFIRSLKEGVQIKHVLVVLFVVFLLLTPNALYAVDAGIPFEEKERYNRQIHDALPSFLRPPEEEGQEGHQYLGAFGYSMDKPTDHWPTAWRDIQDQNSGIPPEERPAFLSWWDYGFEAMNQGELPTVSDNFQHAHRFAGNFLMAQNESEMLGLLIGRQLQLPYNEEGSFEGDVERILIDHLGEEKKEKLEDIYDNPGSYRNEVLNNPDRYHPRADDIDNANVRWAMVMGTLSYEDIETLSSLYREISYDSGYERLENRIGYFAVDSRLFPTSARDTGIFHAPAFLSGHRVQEEGETRVPVDFYTMQFIDQQGRSYESQEEIPEEAQIVDQEIEFKEMFYNSALYRIFAGYSLQEVEEGEGIPGIDDQQSPSMPGWNLTHFSEVHRTAYFNPHPQDEVQNHTDAWRAMPYREAMQYDPEEDNVTVDDTPRSYMSQGVVFLEYNDGAIVEGQVRTEDGEPVSNAKVTVIDTEIGTPHHTTRTDSEGRYEAILPEGDMTVTVSTGGFDDEPMGRQQQREQIALGAQEFEISRDQAMRREIDRTGDGRWDYLLEEDIIVEPGQVEGRVFLDRTGDGEYNPENDTLVSKDGHVNLMNEQSDVNYSVEIEEGNYRFDSVVPGRYTIDTSIEGSSPIDGLIVERAQQTDRDIPVSMGNLTVTYDGQPLDRESVTLSLTGADQTTELTLGEQDSHEFENLAPGTYTLEIEEEGYTLKNGPQEIRIEPGESLTRAVTVVKAHRLEGVLTRGGEELANQRLNVFSKEYEARDAIDRDYDRDVMTDENGEFSIKLPRGDYQLHGVNRRDGEVTAYLNNMVIESDTYIEGEFVSAHKLRGTAEYEGENVSSAEIYIMDGSGRQYYLTTNENGRFSTHLPEGRYTVYGWNERDFQDPDDIGENLYFWREIGLHRNREISIEGSPGRLIEGTVYREQLGVTDPEPVGDGISANIKLSVSGRTIRTRTTIDGYYRFFTPEKETRMTIEKEGYYQKSVTLDPSEVTGDRDIYLRAKDVIVEGDLDFDRDEELAIEFRAVDDGAVGKEVTVDGDSYSVELQPGRYEIVSEHMVMDGDAKYEISDQLTIRPGDENIERSLTSVYKLRLFGDIHIGEDPADAEIHFQGPEEKMIYGEGSYEVYLEAGDYSVRAVHPYERYTMQMNLTLEEPKERDIALEEAVHLDTLIDGPGGHEIPVSLRNLDTGYIINTETDVEGNLDLNITGGPYEITVDYVIAEEIADEERQVRYHFEGEYEIPPTPGVISLDSEILNSTLSGQVSLNGGSVADLNVIIRSEEGHERVETTDEDGIYKFDQLIHGRYSVYISHETSGRTYSHFESFEMPVDDKQMDISLEEGVIFSGRVELDGAGVQTSISLTRREASQVFETSEDGSFRILLPEDVYHVESETTDDSLYGLIDYRYSSELDITSDIQRDIELSKVEEYGMEFLGLDSKHAPLGETIEYDLHVRNTGNTPDEYELSVADTDWEVNIDPAMTSEIIPGDQRQVSMEITIPEDAKVGETVTLNARSVNSDEAIEEEIPLEVEQIFGVELSEETRDGTYRRGELSYSLDIDNMGNGPDSFQLDIMNKQRLRDQGWEVTVQEQTEQLDSEETSSVRIYLNATRSNPRPNVEVELRANSLGDNTVSELRNIQASIPQLVAYEDSLAFEGEEFIIEDEPFQLSNLQWTGIIILVAIAVVFVMRKKRWI